MDGNSGSFNIRKSAWQPQIDSASAKRGAESAVEALTVRVHSANGRFARTTQCLAGRITCILQNGDNHAAPFRKLLVEAQSHPQAEVKLGDRPLLPTEVHVVCADQFVWSHKTVFDAVKSSGIAESSIPSTAALFGLGAVLHRPAEELTEIQRRALAICCALNVQVRVIVLDDPFSAVATDRQEKVAELLLNQIKQSDRIVVVLGLQKIPSAWAADPSCIVEGYDPKRPRKISFVSKPQDDLVFSVRTLLQNSRTEAGEGNSFYTYPQSIFAATVQPRRAEQVRTEAIPNPNVAPAKTVDPAVMSSALSQTPIPDSSEITRWMQDTLILSNERETVVVSRPKRAKRPLTRVSFINRLTHNLRLIRFVRNLKRAALDVIIRLNAAPFLLPQGSRTRAIRRNREERLFLAAALIVVLSVLAALRNFR